MLNKIFSAFLLLPIWLTANPKTQESYRALIEEFPQLNSTLGNASKGEIEILLSQEKMDAVEKSTGRDVGVVARDAYWVWINDACRFPSGHEGVYGRILWAKTLKNQTATGVIVIPIMPDGKIALNCNFRHATRTWEIELPRGGLEANETIEEAARRETLEETGMVVKELIYLGGLPPDTGLTATVAPIFAAKVQETSIKQNEETEAIEGILTLSLAEIKKGFVEGSYRCIIRGEEKEVNFRDPFLAYALLLSELKGIISLD